MRPHPDGARCAISTGTGSALRPSILFSFLFLIGPSFYLVAGAFQNVEGAFTFDNMLELGSPNIVASFSLSVRLSPAVGPDGHGRRTAAGACCHSWRPAGLGAKRPSQPSLASHRISPAFPLLSRSSRHWDVSALSPCSCGPLRVQPVWGGVQSLLLHRPCGRLPLLPAAVDVSRHHAGARMG